GSAEAAPDEPLPPVVPDCVVAVGSGASSSAPSPELVPPEVVPSSVFPPEVVPPEVVDPASSELSPESSVDDVSVVSSSGSSGSAGGVPSYPSASSAVSARMATPSRITTFSGACWDCPSGDSQLPVAHPDGNVFPSKSSRQSRVKS